MKAKIITLFLFLAISCIGQDSLVRDSAFKQASTALTTRKKSKKKKRPFQTRKIIAAKADTNNLGTAKSEITDTNEYSTMSGAFICILLATAVSGYCYINYWISRNITSRNHKGEYIFSDSIMRRFMSRRRYYNEVYLKSDEWQRKRYVVLRRDNWRCVYCGARATEVHHNRYAKYNIGKEPIGWLVSLCRACHNHQHF